MKAEGAAYEATGIDPFGVVDVGLEVELSNVLLGVAVETWIDGVDGIDTDAPAGDGADADASASPWNGPIVPSIGPSVRIGYAFW